MLANPSLVRPAIVAETLGQPTRSPVALMSSVAPLAATCPTPLPRPPGSTHFVRLFVLSVFRLFVIATLGAVVRRPLEGDKQDQSSRGGAAVAASSPLIKPDGRISRIRLTQGLSIAGMRKGFPSRRS
jgi:hypothetical protein